MRYATMPRVEDRLLSQQQIELPNGYKILMKHEQISHVGRSIFRDFADHQFVLEIVDPGGKSTKRLPLPSIAADQVSQFITGAPER